MSSKYTYTPVCLNAPIARPEKECSNVRVFSLSALCFVKNVPVKGTETSLTLQILVKGASLTSPQYLSAEDSEAPGLPPTAQYCKAHSQLPLVISI